MITTNIRIGDVLKEYGYINDEQISNALEYQKNNRGVKLGNALIALNYITEKQMLQALAQRLRLRTVDISEVTVEIEAAAMIPKLLAEKYCMLGVKLEEHTLTLVTDDPMNFYAQEDIRQLTGMQLELELCEREPLVKAISYYYAEVEARKAAKDANNSTKTVVEEIEIEEGDDETPIIKLLNSLIVRASSTKASDIHVEPFENKTLVRMRIDGAIVDYITLQKSLHTSLIARIKIMADLDIAERRLPQDGHFKMKLEDGEVNIRVSLIPTVYGEKAVLRLLSSAGEIDHATTFGMAEEEFEKFRRMMKIPHGIIYLTGPTGSGKTTTLYMILEELAKRQVNISTIEDPVEKNIPKINQMQVNIQAGLTFELGLRALLRQDPDIIMVGETRDPETASISIRAAITGHLVYSTLHTNSAASSVARLEDMGLESYMVANSLVGIVAQRLLRKVCTECAQSVPMEDEEAEFIGERIPMVKKAVGCKHCNYTGYHGRIAIHEILVIDNEIRRMISKGATSDEIEAYAIQNQGMKKLKQSGISLVRNGVTTMDELMKFAYADE